MQRDEQLALSRLVRIVVRRHTTGADVTDEDVLDRLREVLGYDDATFEQLCVEIVATAETGWVWNSRWRGWEDRSEARRQRPGRPPRPCFLAAWELARIELLGPLRREPKLIEIAARLRRSTPLRDLAGIEKSTQAGSLVRHYRRVRNYVRPVC